MNPRFEENRTEDGDPRPLPGPSSLAASDGTDRGRDWPRAIRAVWTLARDNDDTTAVFHVIDALRGPADGAHVARLRQDPVGRRLLAEKPPLARLLSDRARLEAMPAGSLGRHYATFMQTESLTPDGLTAASEAGYSERAVDPDDAYFGDLLRDSHDLWHVLTGYGRDPLGELALLEFLYAQARVEGARFIAWLGLTRVPFEYPGARRVAAVREGARLGREAAWLPAVDWREHLPRPLKTVRRDLGIGAPVIYRAALRHHRPERSGSRAARARARIAA